MSKFSQVLRTTSSIEHLLREITRCTLMTVRHYAVNSDWEWREISVSKVQHFTRNEHESISYKWVRFNGRMHQLGIRAHILFSSSERQVDSGMGETSAQSSPLQICKARIYIEEHGRNPNKSYAVRCFRNSAGGLNVL
jgi:hypothetical protein